MFDLVVGRELTQNSLLFGFLGTPTESDFLLHDYREKFLIFPFVKVELLLQLGPPYLIIHIRLC